MKPSGSCLESCSGTVARSKGWHLARKSFKAATSRLGSCWLSPASWNLFPNGRESSESNPLQHKTTENPQGSLGKTVLRACPLPMPFQTLAFHSKQAHLTRTTWLRKGLYPLVSALHPEDLALGGNSHSFIMWRCLQESQVSHLVLQWNYTHIEKGSSPPHVGLWHIYSLVQIQPYPHLCLTVKMDFSPSPAVTQKNLVSIEGKATHYNSGRKGQSLESSTPPRDRQVLCYTELGRKAFQHREIKSTTKT